MKKVTLFLVLALLVSIGNVEGQINSIQLEGKMDSSLVSFFGCKEFLIKVCNPINKFINKEEIIRVPLSPDGKFKINIQSDSTYTYLSFWVVNSGNNKYSLGDIFPVNFPARSIVGLDEIYLFKKSDKIRIFIGVGGMLDFQGKGADKLNCQYQLYNLERIPISVNYRKYQLVGQQRYNEAYNLQGEALNSALQMRLMIIESYKNEFDKEVYGRLYCDAIAGAEFAFVSQLWKETLILANNPKEPIIALQNYYTKYLLEESAKVIDSTFILKSAYYPEYLFMKEWNAYKLFSNDYEKGSSFIDIYQILNKKYTGKLRDELLLICIRTLNRYFSTEILSYHDFIKTSLQNKSYKDLFQDWYNQKSKAFPFELEDVNGTIHKLSEYKGKLVVIDIWFTGCTWCSNLNTAMKTITKKYKENKNIVFISVCTDRRKETWLKSISTGRYTTPETINLYTNGLGGEHPLLKHYNFVGAPWQLIISKNGQLISSSPPRPDGDIIFKADKMGTFLTDSTMVISSPSAKAFIKLLDDNLISNR